MAKHYITANKLIPGDIALWTVDQTRWFGTFDVSIPAGPDDGDVRVWTTVSDQERGHPATIDLNPLAALLIARRDA